MKPFNKNDQKAFIVWLEEKGFEPTLEHALEYATSEYRLQEIFFFDDIVDRVREEFKVDDIFDPTDIREWASDNCYIHEDDAYDYVMSDKRPEEVFTKDELEDWATENGWIKEEGKK